MGRHTNARGNTELLQSLLNIIHVGGLGGGEGLRRSKSGGVDEEKSEFLGEPQAPVSFQAQSKPGGRWREAQSPRTTAGGDSRWQNLEIERRTSWIAD